MCVENVGVCGWGDKVNHVGVGDKMRKVDGWMELLKIEKRVCGWVWQCMVVVCLLFGCCLGLFLLLFGVVFVVWGILGCCLNLRYQGLSWWQYWYGIAQPAGSKSPKRGKIEIIIVHNKVD